MKLGRIGKMSLVIKNLKPTQTSYIDADWFADDLEDDREDLYLLAENMGYKIIGIYNELGHLAVDDCFHGTLFLEPIEQKTIYEN